MSERSKADVVASAIRTMGLDCYEKLVEAKLEVVPEGMMDHSWKLLRASRRWRKALDDQRLAIEGCGESQDKFMEAMKLSAAVVEAEDELMEALKLIDDGAPAEGLAC